MIRMRTSGDLAGDISERVLIQWTVGLLRTSNCLLCISVLLFVYLVHVCVEH